MLRRLTPAEWTLKSIEAQDCLLGSLFTTTSRIILPAKTGTGKTMLGIAIAYAMHLGESFLHWAAGRGGRVLYIDGEMPQELMQERIADGAKWFGAEPPSDGLFFVSWEDFEDMPPLDTEAGQDWIDRLIERLGGVDFVVFDNLQSLIQGKLTDEESWTPLKPWVRSLTKRHVGQLWLHHTGLDTSRGYGTTTRNWEMDTVIVAEKQKESSLDIHLKLKFSKARRRTPDTRGDYEERTIWLRDGKWQSMTKRPETKLVSKAPESYGQAIDVLDRLIEAEGKLKLPAATEFFPDAVELPAVPLERWRNDLKRIGLLDSDEKTSHITSSGRKWFYNVRKHGLEKYDFYVLDEDVFRAPQERKNGT